MRLLAELKRRRVYHVALAYVAVGLGVLGAAELILDPLGLEGARPFIVILTLLGFPLALVLAWAYEVRPEGSSEAWRSGGQGPTGDAAQHLDPDSIVVLPFANLSADAENEYFTDGMTEEIINALVNGCGLRVIARTSAFAFKGSNRDVREIGRELGVGTVLEGSVRKAGDRLRITAQLIDVSGGHHLWSERYDRDLEDVFAIQDEIARIISHRLQAGARGLHPRERPTDDMEAYDAFLRGRFYYARATPEDFARSVEHYELATALDPEFAQAHAGLADTWSYWALLGDPSDRFPRATAAARRALEIDETLADAHATLGFVSCFFDWDWDGARRAFERAIELNPNSATVRHQYAGCLSNLGNAPEALTHARRCVQLDPLSALANHILAYSHYVAAQYDDTIDYETRALEIAPGLFFAHGVKGMALSESGRLAEAEAHYRTGLERWPDEPLLRACATDLFVRMDQRDEALEQLGEVERCARAGKSNIPQCLAWAHTVLGNRDEAFQWIERGIEARDPFVLSLSSFRWWDPLRSDPRYEAILRELKFPEWSGARGA